MSTYVNPSRQGAPSSVDPLDLCERRGSPQPPKSHGLTKRPSSRKLRRTTSSLTSTTARSTPSSHHPPTSEAFPSTMNKPLRSSTSTKSLRSVKSTIRNDDKQDPLILDDRKGTTCHPYEDRSRNRDARMSTTKTPTIPPLPRMPSKYAADLKRLNRDHGRVAKDESEDFQEDYGEVVIQGTLGLGLEDRLGARDGLLVGSTSTRPEEWVGSDQILPIIPPFQVPYEIDRLASALTSMNKIVPHSHPPTHPNSSSSKDLDVSLPLPTIHHPAAGIDRFVNESKETGERPDGFVLTEYLLTRPDLWGDYRAWLVELGEYPRRRDRGEREKANGIDDLPDLFSNAQTQAIRSNGNLIVVTFYRPVIEPTRPNIPPCPTRETHVYVTPAPKIDLEPLGMAVLKFRERLGYVNGPIEEIVRRKMGGNEGWEVLHGTSRVKGSSVDEPKVADDARIRKGSKGLSESELQYLISQTANSIPVNKTLVPGVHERFNRYGAIFHTHPPAAATPSMSGLKDQGGSRGTRPGKVGPEREGRDLGYDMRVICAFTGGTGITIACELDDQAHVTIDIYTSWQFWSLQDRILIEIGQLVYRAVRPSLVISEVVNKSLGCSGFSLPTRSFKEKDSRTGRLVLPDIPLIRCKLKSLPPESMWPNFPDPLARTTEHSILESFHQDLVARDRATLKATEFLAKQQEFLRTASIQRQPAATPLRPLTLGSGAAGMFITPAAMQNPTRMEGRARTPRTGSTMFSSSSTLRGSDASGLFSPR